MFRYNLWTAFVILHAAKVLSAEQDLFGLTNFPEPINSDSLQTSDSLFWAELDDSAAGGLESFYSIEDLNVENTSQKFRSPEDQSSISDASSPSSEENIFASSNHADLFEEGNTAVGDSVSPPCEGNLIERSLNFARSPEELADSFVRDYCLPSKTQPPPSQLNLPKDLNDLDDLLNPKLPTPLLDPLLRVFPYRVLCPLIGEYTIVCCASGSGTKRPRIRCLTHGETQMMRQTHAARSRHMFSAVFDSMNPIGPRTQNRKGKRQAALRLLFNGGRTDRR